MGRSPCCDESGLKKGPWTQEEDEILVNYIKKHGHGSWRALPKIAGLNRCGKSCRLRWTNYLRPDIKRGRFSPEEENTILNLHAVLGNKWSAIASHLPGRTDNEIKNFWNTHLKKKLLNMGYDPMTHRPRTDIFSSLPQLLALANLKELMDQPHHSLEEHAIMRLQAEAMATKLQFLQYLFQSPQPPAATSIANPNPNTSSNSFIDMDSLKLLSSLLQVLYPASGCVPPLPPAAVLGPLAFSSLHENNLSFPRLPELQNLGRFQTTPAKVDDHIVQAQVRERSMPFEQSENSSNPPWQTPMLTSRSSSQIVANDPIPDSIVNVTRDHACSSSLSYDAPIWPDLLLDDLPFSSSP